MAGQKGRDVLIRISDGAEPESFNTVAGVRTSTFELNQKGVDATSMESPDGWRELLAGAGLRWVRVRGRGLFKDAASDERMRAVFMGGELCRFRLTVPGLTRLMGQIILSQADQSLGQALLPNGFDLSPSPTGRSVGLAASGPMAKSWTLPV